MSWHSDFTLVRADVSPEDWRPSSASARMSGHCLGRSEVVELARKDARARKTQDSLANVMGPTQVLDDLRYKHVLS